MGKQLHNASFGDFVDGEALARVTGENGLYSRLITCRDVKNVCDKAFHSRLVLCIGE